MEAIKQAADKKIIVIIDRFLKLWMDLAFEKEKSSFARKKQKVQNQMQALLEQMGVRSFRDGTDAAGQIFLDRVIHISTFIGGAVQKHL